MLKKTITLLFLISLTVPKSFTQQDFQVVFDEDSEPVSKLIMSDSDSTRVRIVEKARDYIGIGYHYGQSNAYGFDCSGYVKFVYKGIGIDLPHSSSEQYKKSKHIKVKDAKPGDLVFFVTKGKSISHVGIYLGDNLFVHSPSKGKTVAIDSLEAAYYKKHMVGFGTFL